MIHINQSEANKSPQEKSPVKAERSEEGSLPSISTDCEGVTGDTSLEDNTERARSRRSSNSTPTKLSTPPSTPNSEGNFSPSSRVGGRSRSSSSGRNSVTPPSGKVGKASSKGRRPSRPGITWREFAKVEARDFQNQWYPAKIAELDDSDKTVLIHFDGWNTRFDEWIKMDSDRLRPATRHSDRREKKVAKPKAVKPPVKPPGKPTRPLVEHKVGEHVFAKWSDCRMYPAKIMGIKSTGTYDVLFYDGFRKSVQNINIKQMPQEVREEYGKAGLLADPRKIKQNRAMFEKLAEKERQANEELEKQRKLLAGQPFEPSKTPDSEASTSTAMEDEQEKKPETEEDQAKSPEVETKTKVQSQRKKPPASGAPFKPVRTRSRAEDEEKPGTSGEPGTEKPKTKEIGAGRKRKKLAVGGAFMARKKAKLEVKGKRGKKPKEIEKVKSPEDTPEVPKKPKIRKNKDESGEKKTSPKMKDPKTTDKPKVKRKKPKGLKLPKIPQDEGSTSVTTDEPPVASVSEPPDSPSPQSLMPTTPLTKGEPGEGPLTPATPSVPSKAFLIEDDHNKYKCPFPDCGKAFRKKSLVEYHVKYYHTSDGTPVQAPPPKKRKKTISVCSETDSEISVGGGGRMSVGKARKKARESVGSMASSVPSTPSTPLETSVTVTPPPPPKEPVVLPPAEPVIEELNVPDNTSEVETRSTTTTTEGYEHHAEILHEEGVDTAEDPESPHDRLAKDEVVNCICQLNEENGLMIQCDVCLCWQHALCMEITEETLPKKYLCYVCLNPPGVRESARFAYDQDWLKQGTMARFNFLAEESNAPQKAQIMKATHELAGDMLNINMVLDSLRKKLHALKNRFHPEFRLWSKDWDKEAERQKEEEEQAEQAAAYENENSLISVDDDFSQIIGSEMLEQLARASMEILREQKIAGGTVSTGDFTLDAPPGLAPTAGLNFGSAAIGASLGSPGMPGLPPDTSLPSTSAMDQSLSSMAQLATVAGLQVPNSVSDMAPAAAPTPPTAPPSGPAETVAPETVPLAAGPLVPSGPGEAATEKDSAAPLVDDTLVGGVVGAEEPTDTPRTDVATPPAPMSEPAATEPPCAPDAGQPPAVPGNPAPLADNKETENGGYVVPTAHVPAAAPPVYTGHGEVSTPGPTAPVPITVLPETPVSSTPITDASLHGALLPGTPVASAPLPDVPLPGNPLTETPVPSALSLLPEGKLSAQPPGPVPPSMQLDESSTSFSMTPEKPVDLNLDNSATESCPEGEDPGVLPMDTSNPDEPLSEIIGSQEIAQALINPGMLDELDPSKLLDDHPDDVSNSSTVTTEEDPKVICEQNLLEHVLRQQDTAENRLDIIEEQIQALESAEDGGNRTGETMRDLPRVKKIVHQLLNDLSKVKRMSMYH